MLGVGTMKLQMASPRRKKVPRMRQVKPGPGVHRNLMATDESASKTSKPLASVSLKLTNCSGLISRSKFRKQRCWYNRIVYNPRKKDNVDIKLPVHLGQFKSYRGYILVISENMLRRMKMILRTQDKTKDWELSRHDPQTESCNNSCLGSPSSSSQKLLKVTTCSPLSVTLIGSLVAMARKPILILTPVVLLNWGTMAVPRVKLVWVKRL
mmetsp:Transcript_28759/g.60124  ORF Transcript_28759/g.60124 Transcript_28759/m.60124 type:complete len:210 (+) Transcript_28759:1999-2628(+)